MSPDKDMSNQPERSTNDDVKRSTTPTDNSGGAVEEPKGDMGGYVVSMLSRIRERSRMTLYQRIFKYADRTSWTLNIIAFVAAIAAGTLLPLM